MNSILKIACGILVCCLAFQAHAQRGGNQRPGQSQRVEANVSDDGLYTYGYFDYVEGGDYLVSTQEQGSYFALNNGGVFNDTLSLNVASGNPRNVGKTLRIDIYSGTNRIGQIYDFTMQSGWSTYELDLSRYDNVTGIHLDIEQNGLTGFYLDPGSAIESSTLASAVPEPSTYAMIAAGLGLVGWTARRRSLRK